MATRKQIRQAVAQVIAPHFSRVLPYNAASVDQRDFPLALAFIEAGDTEGNYHDGYESEALLIVECWNKDGQDIDSALDKMANDVNAALEQDETLGGLIDGLTRQGFNIERDPESFTGSIALNFIVHYSDED